MKCIIFLNILFIITFSSITAQDLDSLNEAEQKAIKHFEEKVIVPQGAYRDSVIIGEYAHKILYKGLDGDSGEEAELLFRSKVNEFRLTPGVTPKSGWDEPSSLGRCMSIKMTDSEIGYSICIKQNSRMVTIYI